MCNESDHKRWILTDRKEAATLKRIEVHSLSVIGRSKLSSLLAVYSTANTAAVSKLSTNFLHILRAAVDDELSKISPKVSPKNPPSKKDTSQRKTKTADVLGRYG